MFQLVKYRGERFHEVAGTAGGSLVKGTWFGADIASGGSQGYASVLLEPRGALTEADPVKEEGSLTTVRLTSAIIESESLTLSPGGREGQVG